MHKLHILTNYPLSVFGHLPVIKGLQHSINMFHQQLGVLVQRYALCNADSIFDLVKVSISHLNPSSHLKPKCN